MCNQIIEQRADTIIKEYDEYFADRWRTDLTAIAIKEGITVITASINKKDDGFILIEPDVESLYSTGSNKVIVVDKTLPLSMQRFTIAHELAHYYSDYKGKVEHTGQVYEHRTTKEERKFLPVNKREHDMDYFAACLLMPKYKFVKVFKILSKHLKKPPLVIRKIAMIFGVSDESVLRRVKELELQFGV